jgi:hypothetical protein
MRSAEREPSPKPDVPPAPARRSRPFLVAAAVLAAAWMLTLALLAIYTANPVMLNWDQIQASAYVVTGTVVGDPAKGQVAVAREWKKQALSGTITVENLREAGALTGREYIIPLSRPDDAFRVTETPYSDGSPLVYPASPDALEQLQKILQASKAGATPKST